MWRVVPPRPRRTGHRFGCPGGPSGPLDESAARIAAGGERRAPVGDEGRGGDAEEDGGEGEDHDGLRVGAGRASATSRRRRSRNATARAVRASSFAARNESVPGPKIGSFVEPPSGPPGRPLRVGSGRPLRDFRRGLPAVLLRLGLGRRGLGLRGLGLRLRGLGLGLRLLAKGENGRANLARLLGRLRVVVANGKERRAADLEPLRDYARLGRAFKRVVDRYVPKLLRPGLARPRGESVRNLLRGRRDAFVERREDGGFAGADLPGPDRVRVGAGLPVPPRGGRAAIDVRGDRGDDLGGRLGGLRIFRRGGAVRRLGDRRAVLRLFRRRATLFRSNVRNVRPGSSRVGSYFARRLGAARPPGPLPGILYREPTSKRAGTVGGASRPRPFAPPKLGPFGKSETRINPELFSPFERGDEPGRAGARRGAPGGGTGARARR
jgi:hypothetical protein